MTEYFTDPQAVIAERVQNQLSLINEAVVAIGGEDASVEAVFPLPPAVRDDAPNPTWDTNQEFIARDLGNKLGYASEFNVASGVVGGIRIIEGGKAWKMLAEISALGDESVDVWNVVLAGSPNRKIGQDEVDFLQTQGIDTGVEEPTEYDVAKKFALNMITTDPRKSYPLPLGYEVAEGNAFVATETGQFESVGDIDDLQEVIVLRVDREDYVDPDTNQQKYRHQPDSLRLMGIVSDMLTSQRSDLPVVLMTSNAYASRQIDVLRAGLANDREFAVAMYGRQTLADVKNEPILPGARLNQLPGDIRLYHDKLVLLQQELQADTAE